MIKFIISSLVIPSLLLLGLTTANSSSPNPMEGEPQKRSQTTLAIDPNDNNTADPSDNNMTVTADTLKSISIKWLEQNQGQDGATFLIASCNLSEYDEKLADLVAKLTRKSSEEELVKNICLDIKGIFRTVFTNSCKDKLLFATNVSKLVLTYLKKGETPGNFTRALAKVPTDERESVVGHLYEDMSFLKWNYDTTMA